MAVLDYLSVWPYQLGWTLFFSLLRLLPPPFFLTWAWVQVRRGRCRHFPLEAEPPVAVKHQHFRLLLPACLFLQQNDSVCRKVFSRGRSFQSDWWTGIPFCCLDLVAALLPQFSSISLRHLDVTPSLSSQIQLFHGEYRRQLAMVPGLGGSWQPTQSGLC